MIVQNKTIIPKTILERNKTTNKKMEQRLKIQLKIQDETIVIASEATRVPQSPTKTLPRTINTALALMIRSAQEILDNSSNRFNLTRIKRAR